MIINFSQGKKGDRQIIDSDSGIIDSKVFVDRIYQDFKDYFSSRHEKKPKVIPGLVGVYSLKRLSEAI